MEYKHRIKTVIGFALLVVAGLLGSLVLASPAQAAVVVIQINDGEVPTKATGAEQSCDNLPDDIGGDEDGWVFVLPASAGATGNFISVTATFEDANGDEQVYTTGANGGIVSGSGDNKAFIITPAGWTLIAAEAEVEDPDEGAFFNLTHACAGLPDDSPTTPTDQTTAPDQTTKPGEQSTTEGPLPTTGAPVQTVLLWAVVVAAAGGAALLFMRRRAEARNQ
jgi:hypothetical protein